MRKTILLLSGLIILIPFSLFARGGKYDSFIETFPNGKINWKEGYVEAAGSGDIPDSENTAVALRAARIDARGNMLKIMKGIRIDGDRMITDISDAAIRLKGFIKGAERISKKTKTDSVEVVLRAPLKGVNGLSTEIIKNEEFTSAENGGTVNTVKVSLFENKKFVLIDARGTSLNPALLPKIYDSSGNVLYSPDKVKRNALKKRGMVSYVTLGKNEKTVQTQNNGSRSDDNKKKKKRHRGYRKIKVKKPEAEGKLKANITVSKEDAKKILQAEKDFNILSECRIVVVMDTEVGGIEGEIPFEKEDNPRFLTRLKRHL